MLTLSESTFIIANISRHLHSDLPDGAVLAKYIVHFLARDLVRQITHVQDAIDLGGQTNLRGGEEKDGNITKSVNIRCENALEVTTGGREDCNISRSIKNRGGKNYK